MSQSVPRRARRPAARPRRVLVASHGHPAITRGGAENAAYALFQALDADPAYQAWFLGCRPGSGGHLGVRITQPFDAREYVYTPGDFDWFKFANRDPAFPAEFRALLEELRPDIVHFHHFAFFGLEAFWLVKTVLPAAKVVLTAHEYLLICHAYGQMVTRQHQFLCHGASPAACHACFPEIGEAEFFLRRHYATLFLPSLDAAIAPSAFLANRLLDWGLGVPRLDVIENLVPSPAAPPPPPAEPGRLRVGFFGQISRLKGIGVLLAAARLLEAAGDRRVAIDIHGTYAGQPPEFQAEFLEQLAAAGPNVRFHGPYRPGAVDALMAGVAAVLVPSIWWENSPVVIQEAFRNNRPVICSPIGGMAEKVRHGMDGWHVAVGDAAGLAELLAALAADPARIDAMRATLRRPAPPEAALAAHRALYDDLCG